MQIFNVFLSLCDKLEGRIATKNVLGVSGKGKGLKARRTVVKFNGLINFLARGGMGKVARCRKIVNIGM